MNKKALSIVSDESNGMSPVYTLHGLKCSQFHAVCLENSAKLYALADLRGASDTRAPPFPGVQSSFIFMLFSAKRLQNNPTLGVAPPPLPRKILDPPLVCWRLPRRVGAPSYDSVIEIQNTSTQIKTEYNSSDSR